MLIANSLIVSFIKFNDKNLKKVVTKKYNVLIF